MTSPSSSTRPLDQPRPRGLILGLKVGCVILAGVEVLYHVELGRKIHAAAALQHTYFQALEKPALRPRVLEQGRVFADRLGHTKSFYKNYLLLGHGAHLLGQDAVAISATRYALDLHPYSTHDFQLMATLSADPDQAVLWQEAYQHLMNEATRGFEWVYPGSTDQLEEPSEDR